MVNNGKGELFTILKCNAINNILLEVKILLPTLLFEEAVDDFIYVVENWIDLASAIRNEINTDAYWEVYIDDAIIKWDSKGKKYMHPSL